MKARPLNEPTCCTKCGNTFPWSPEFFKKGRGRSGCMQPCRKCDQKQSNEWKRKNREHCNKVTAEWRKNNRERHNANAKRWRDAHKEKAHAATKRWEKQNPIAKRLNAHQQRIKRYAKTSRGTCTKQDIDLQHERQKGRCWWCKTKLNGKYHVDHRVPLSKGGMHDRSNIVISCEECNRSKGAKLPQEFAGRLF